MQIGFTSTTFKLLQPDEICALGAKAGADCIEWSEPHIPDPARARAIAVRCADAGIACNSLGSYYRVGEDDAAHWETLCQTAAAMGAVRIRVWLGKKGSEKTSEAEYAALLADAERMLRVAVGFGLVVAAEAHQNTYNDSCESSLRFLRELNNPAFGTYFQSLYLDLPADLERLAQTFAHIFAAHVSFSEVRRNRLMHLLPPERDCVDRIVRALCERDFRQPLLLEYCQCCGQRAFFEDMARLRELVKDGEAAHG